MSFDISLYKNFKKKIDLYLSVKQYEPSVELLKNKLLLYPTDLRLMKLLALVYVCQDERQQAIELLTKASRIHSEDKELKLLFLVLHCEYAEYEKARECFLQLKENSSELLGGTLSNEKLADDYISCGLTFYKSNNFSRAAVQFSHALTLCPESVEATVCLAKTQLKQGEAEVAGLLLKEYCKDHPPSSEIFLWLGLVYFKLSRFSLASLHFERAKDLNPENRVADVYMRLLFEMGQGIPPASNPS